MFRQKWPNKLPIKILGWAREEMGEKENRKFTPSIYRGADRFQYFMAIISARNEVPINCPRTVGWLFNGGLGGLLGHSDLNG